MPSWIKTSSNPKTKFVKDKRDSRVVVGDFVRALAAWNPSKMVVVEVLAIVPGFDQYLKNGCEYIVKHHKTKRKWRTSHIVISNFPRDPSQRRLNK